MGNSAHELKHGTSGTSGADGTSGVSGTSGTSGNGTSGTSGVTGSSGTSGTSGADGTFSGSSGTSGTTPSLASPGTIGGTTPGIVYATMKEIYKTASADSPLTALQVSRTIVSNYGMTDADCVIALPTAAEGYTFICILPAVRARYFKFRADTNDKIYLSGVAGSNNAYVGVASGYATADSAQFFTFKASDGGFDWYCIPIKGTWLAS